MKKFMAIALTFVLCLSATTSLTYGASWVKSQNNWHYTDNNGKNYKNKWIKSGNSWYYIDGRGYMVSGRTISIGGATYSFASNGKMETGWKKESRSWKYYKQNGAQAKSGWLLISGDWYYFDGSGNMLSDSLKKIGNSYFYFKKNGKMDTGWIKYNKQYYFADSNGAIVRNGWRKSGSSWYYFKKNGVCACNEVLTINDKKYGFDSNYRNFTGWNKVKGKVLYANSNGEIMSDCWITYQGYSYRLNRSGDRLKDKETKIDNETYRFDKEGKMITGWYFDRGKWEYFNKAGKKRFEVKGNIDARTRANLIISIR